MAIWRPVVAHLHLPVEVVRRLEMNINELAVNVIVVKVQIDENIDIEGAELVGFVKLIGDF